MADSMKIKKIENLDSVMAKLQRVVSAKHLKTSKQRENVLALIYSSKTHLSPEEITRHLKKEAKASLSSVYRILLFLETYGLITSVETKTGKRYEIAAKEHHYHIICLSCGQIMEFVDDSIRQKQFDIAKTLKCEPISDNLRLFVICGKCVAKKKKSED